MKLLKIASLPPIIAVQVILYISIYYYGLCVNGIVAQYLGLYLFPEMITSYQKKYH